MIDMEDDPAYKWLKTKPSWFLNIVFYSFMPIAIVIHTIAMFVMLICEPITTYKRIKTIYELWKEDR